MRGQRTCGDTLSQEYTILRDPQPGSHCSAISELESVRIGITRSGVPEFGTVSSNGQGINWKLPGFAMNHQPEAVCQQSLELKSALIHAGALLILRKTPEFRIFHAIQEFCVDVILFAGEPVQPAGDLKVEHTVGHANDLRQAGMSGAELSVTEFKANEISVGAGDDVEGRHGLSGCVGLDENGFKPRRGRGRCLSRLRKALSRMEEPEYDGSDERCRGDDGEQDFFA